MVNWIGWKDLTLTLDLILILNLKFTWIHSSKFFDFLYAIKIVLEN